MFQTSVLLSNLLYAIKAAQRGQAVEEMAERDWPTNLLHMRLLQEKGCALISLARRLNQDIEVIYGDIDDFGEVDKKAGYNRANLILSHLGAAVWESMRGNDVPFVQGDQILIVSLGGGHVHQLAKRIHEAWNRKVDMDETLVALRQPGRNWRLPNQLSFSYGHQIIHPDDSGEPEKLLRWASDEANQRMSFFKFDRKRYRKQLTGNEQAPHLPALNA